MKFQNLYNLINVLNQIFLLKTFFYVFSIFFQSLMGLEKLRCDVPCGTTQPYFHPQVLPSAYLALMSTWQGPPTFNQHILAFLETNVDKIMIVRGLTMIVSGFPTLWRD